MTKVFKSSLDCIGNTPLLTLSKLGQDIAAQIYVKAEFFNPGGSIKDRVGNYMILKAEKEGKIKGKATVIEPTSGNTGIGLALACLKRNYALILTMPSSMSQERKSLLKAFGANLVLTSPEKGMQGAIDKANEIAQETKNSFQPQQFSNPANPEIHYLTTAPEIWQTLKGDIDIFIAGVGTGGTITGVGKFLKGKNPQIKIIAVEPEKSPVLSGGKAGSHNIQGIGAGFIPEVLDTQIYDEIIPVSEEEAFHTARLLSSQEGILAGISAGAAVFAALEVGKRKENKNKKIVTILPDTGERYLSTALFNKSTGR